MGNKIYLAKMINKEKWETPIEIGELLQCNIKPIEKEKYIKSSNGRIIGVVSIFKHNNIYLNCNLKKSLKIYYDCFYALLLEIDKGCGEFEYHTYFKCLIDSINKHMLEMKSFVISNDSRTISHKISTKSNDFNKELHDEMWGKHVKLPIAKINLS